MLNVEIRIKGRIAPHWSDWFEGLAVTYTGDDTILIGEILDQAALYGLVARVRDLGLSLVAVNSVEIEHHESEKECRDEILGD